MSSENAGGYEEPAMKQQIQLQCESAKKGPQLIKQFI